MSRKPPTGPPDSGPRPATRRVETVPAATPPAADDGQVPDDEALTDPAVVTVEDPTPERRRPLHERLAPIVSVYFPETGEPRDAGYNAEVSQEYSDDYSESAALSRKKRIPDAALQPIQYERYIQYQQELQRRYFAIKADPKQREQAKRLLQRMDRPILTLVEWTDSETERIKRYTAAQERMRDRINEDVVHIGKGCHVVCDGTTNENRNVSGLMGEAVAMAAQDVADAILDTNPPPSDEVIQSRMRSIIPTARLGLLKALQGNELFRAIEGQYNRARDFATTVEVVIQVPWLHRAYVLHVGDSRTYHIPLIDQSGQGAQLVHAPHSHFDSGRNRTVTSSVASLDLATASQVDITAVEFRLGDRLVSISDGGFAAYDALQPRNPQLFPYEASLLNYSRSSDDCMGLARRVQTVGQQCQDNIGRWDDGAVAVTEVDFDVLAQLDHLKKN